MTFSTEHPLEHPPPSCLRSLMWWDISWSSFCRNPLPVPPIKCIVWAGVELWLWGSYCLTLTTQLCPLLTCYLHFMCILLWIIALTFSNGYLSQNSWFINGQFWLKGSHLATSTKLKLYNTWVLPIFLYGLDYWTAGRYQRRTHIGSMQSTSGSVYAASHQMVLLCSQRCCTEANKAMQLTAIIQSRRLTLFWHIMRMDNNADAKRILLASPLVDWRSQPGRPCITWLSTIQQDLKQHHLMLPEAADLGHNRPLWGWCWRMELRNLRVACQKRRWPKLF